MSTQDEVWQAYTELAEPIAIPLTQKQAAEGGLHGAAHLWIWRKCDTTIEIFVQRRAANKRTWPGFYDILAAGHIDYGESPLQAVLRETKEELGLVVAASELKLFFLHRTVMVSGTEPQTIENEFRWIYGMQVNGELELSYDDGEVAATQWMSVTDFANLVDADAAAIPLVPQGKGYFSQLLENIERLT